MQNLRGLVTVVRKGWTLSVVIDLKTAMRRFFHDGGGTGNVKVSKARKGKGGKGVAKPRTPRARKAEEGKGVSTVKPPSQAQAPSVPSIPRYPTQ